MQNTSLMTFEEMERKVMYIRGMYIKAKIRLTMHDENSKALCLQDSIQEGETIYVKPQNFIQAVDAAIQALPEHLQMVIKKEFFEMETYHRYWYLEMLSRSTFYRYKKEALRQFLLLLE